MTKHTARDRVWSAALDLAEYRSDEISSWDRRFSPAEVRSRVDDPPSDRTVRDVLATMADLGHLDRGRRQGYYQAVDESSSSSDVEDDISASGLSRSASDDVGVPVDGDVSPLEDELDDVADRTVLNDDQDELEQLEFPATVDRDDAIDAILAARTYLRDDGPASRREVVQDVMPEHPLGYDVPDLEPGDRFRGSWWRKVVAPGLEALDDVEKPAGGGTWSFTGSDDDR